MGEMVDGDYTLTSPATDPSKCPDKTHHHDHSSSKPQDTSTTTVTVEY